MPRDTAVTDLIAYLPLDASPAVWAGKAIEMVQQNQRADHSAMMKTAGYDIKDSVAWLQNFYLVEHNNHA